MKGTSSYQRTSEYYRDRGYTIVKTEHFYRGLKHDMMGFVDMMALGVGETLMLQACGGSDFAEHRRKILGPCRAKAQLCLMANNRIILIGWRKLKVKKGGAAVRWTPRIEEITLADF